MAQDIRAGRAFVELMLKDGAFVKGLRNASKQLKSFGQNISLVGAGISTMGAAITAPLAAAVSKFVSIGSALTDMSGRTGIAATDLAELGYAARQTGAEMGDVEIGVKKMQKAIGASKGGLVQIGKQFVNMRGLNPAQQFSKAADAITKIKDPTKQAAAAMQIFGKSGANLLPMIRELSEQKKKFRDMGLAPTEQDIANADELGDLFQDLKEIFTAGEFNIGAALFEPLRDAANVVKNLMVETLKWIKANKETFQTIAAVGVGLVALGAVVTAVGLGLTVIGTALGGIASAIGVVLSPLGLLTASLIAGVVAWSKFTSSGQAFMGFLGTLGATFKDTFGGIMDALMGGDLELAGKIGMAGLKVALLQGVAAISEAVGGQWGAFIGKLGTDIASGNLSKAWDTLTLGFGEAWNSAMDGIQNAWEETTRFILDGLSVISATMAKWLIDHAQILNTIVGIMTPGDGAMSGAGAGARWASGGNGGGGKTGVNLIPALPSDVAADARRQLDADRNRNIAARETANADRIARQQKEAEERRKLLNRALGINPDNPAAGPNKALDAAQSDLAKLREEAAKNRKEATDRARDNARAPGLNGGTLANAVSGSFSAGALAAMGSTPIDKVVDEQKRGNVLLGKIERQLGRRARFA